MTQYNKVVVLNLDYTLELPQELFKKFPWTDSNPEQLDTNSWGLTWVSVVFMFPGESSVLLSLRTNATEENTFITLIDLPLFVYLIINYVIFWIKTYFSKIAIYVTWTDSFILALKKTLIMFLPMEQLSGNRPLFGCMLPSGASFLSFQSTLLRHC